MTFAQFVLAAKIEFHWWRIRCIRKKKQHAGPPRSKKLCTAENLHRHKAEIAQIQYEISIGLRNHLGFWK